ncbi:MAG TPA: AcvB/VirJ family lysyl-phosphatidylglycerol hydrolase [Tahibacter sp.]|uniref:AcvB/VirJ family lysyl-phosphatidylglycerol hydrolase n=1 Tax=Tahibacter sp. TaxID=2056211 RepID=UPI002BF11EBF|nr:AcvB/VirJ family lysyl-phosphatidylglycerol hydrolase [Tahibacter sp.]HSX60201.1 AcvB/VirJ family lysyl-phosphatidylglycerol hydrolase [Tahibacter sp.]
MKRIAIALLFACGGAAAATTPVRYGLFGDLHVARPDGTATRTLMFVSDADGWDAREEAYADALAAAGSFVVGIDLPVYLKHLDGIESDCAYPAAHVEEVSHWIQRHENRADYTAPWLVGLDRGATLAYAVAAQAPAGTFAGLVTLGYDFDWRLRHTLCAGDAGVATAADGTRGFRVVPVARLGNPWLPQPYAPGAAIDGLGRELALLRDRVLPAAAPRRNGPQTLAAALQRWDRREARRHEPLPQDVADLPLTDVAPTAAANGRIAIVLTGDGGWAGLDQGVADALAADGVRVIGFSTLKFFWKQRTPDEAAAAVARVVGHYAARNPDARFALVGYSFGASLVPVVFNRLPEAARGMIDLQFMISPDDEAVFEIKVGDWFGGAQHDGALPIAPELAKATTPAVCLHGADEDDSPCPKLAGDKVTSLDLPGGHHYDGDYAAIGKLVLDLWPKRR